MFQSTGCPSLSLWIPRMLTFAIPLNLATHICHRRFKGPFDMIVDAAGLTWLQLQPPLDQPSCAAAVAAVGDARAARSSRGWDVFGVWRVRRVKYGADDALRDGADLGNGLRTGRYVHIP